MQSLAFEIVQDILITLHENIRELRERKRFADPGEQDYIEGKLQAYNEVLSALSSSAKDHGVAEELGL